MKNKAKSFEDYMQDVHAKQYIGLDDEMPDDYDNWLCELDIEDWINYGEKHSLKEQKKMIKRLSSEKDISKDSSYDDYSID